MKQKLILLAVVVALIAFASYQASAGLTSAVPIPDEINLWVAGLIFAGVTAGFVFLFDWLLLDLRGLAAPVSATLSGWVLGELQGWVNLIPDRFDAFVLIGFRILVIILTGVGTLYFLSRQRGGAKGQLIA
jgi:hypothetical protein